MAQKHQAPMNIANSRGASESLKSNKDSTRKAECIRGDIKGNFRYMVSYWGS